MCVFFLFVFFFLGGGVVHARVDLDILVWGGCRSRNLIIIQASLGGSGGMPPPGNF